VHRYAVESATLRDQMAAGRRESARMARDLAQAEAALGTAVGRCTFESS
jgi:hypothetical protein